MGKRKQLKELNLAFVDTETTGLDSKTQEIIEIAAIIYDPRKDKVIKSWERKAAPRNIKTAAPIALEMNGYNEDPKSYKDDIKEVILEFQEVVDGCVIVGQNIQFDIGFIEKYYKEFAIKKGFHRHRKLEISSLVWPVMGYSEADSSSLKAICEHFGISNQGAHRALIDCERTLEVYRCLISLHNQRVELP